MNDAHAAIPNFLRAVKYAPDEVADHAAWPVSEIDMHARHVALLERMDATFVERLRENARFFDAEVAGWWVWGASIWIGSGWCDTQHRNAGNRQRPLLSGGTTARVCKRPQLAGHHVGNAELATLGHGGLLSRESAYRFPPYRKTGARGEIE